MDNEINNDVNENNPVNNTIQNDPSGNENTQNISGADNTGNVNFTIVGNGTVNSEEPITPPEPAASAEPVYVHVDSSANANQDLSQTQAQEGTQPDVGTAEFVSAETSSPKTKDRPFRRGRLALAFLSVILITGIVTSSASYYIFNYYDKNDNKTNGIFSETTSSTKSSTSSSTNTISKNAGDELTVSEINTKVSPSVVYIGVDVISTNMFGQSQTESGSGSGIIMTADGYVLTNFHVIDGAKKITVQTIDGKQYAAEIVGKDSKTDLAVLKIKATGLKPATFGDSDTLKVGDLAVAIGNPLGTMGGTITAGVISALNRSVTIENITMNLIQTDAAVNPGNSGGALVNRYGEVIGIVNAKMSAVGIEGLGYAIPINEAKTTINDLMKSGYVTGRTIIGISVKDITEELASYYNLPVGVYVVEVQSGSPAEKGGLLAEDVIVGVNGEDISTSTRLNEIKDKLKAGDTMKLLINRDGKEKVINIVLEEDKSGATASK